jgi:hypothetical protein
MRRLIITGLTGVFTFSLSMAQMTTPDDSYPQAGFHAGVRYQPQINKIRSEAYGTYDLKLNTSTGNSYAVSLAYFFSNHFSMQTELMYSRVDQNYSSQSTGNHTIRLSYINVPFLLALHTNYGKTFNFNITLGPQLGLNAGSELTGYNGENTAPKAVLSVKPMDLGLAYGTGFDMGLGRTKHLHLSFGLRGVKGLMAIDKPVGTLAGGQYYILENSRINTVGAYLGLMFKL